MLLAEGVITTDSNMNNYVGGFAMQMRVNPNEDKPVVPQEWLTVRGPGKSFSSTAFPCTDGDRTRWLGRRWSDGRNSLCAVYTILPPNSPAVSRDSQGAMPEDWGIAPASSYHPGGAGTVACDVSYRFVTDSVNTSANPPLRKSGFENVTGLSLAFDYLLNARNPDRPEDYTGPSPYGVWGAYGTPDQGDTVAF
jgi:hypothetical protein